jgi:antitoxin component of MazEF toxin-antitoxin module
MEVTAMPQVKLREKGQVTIPADLLQEWSRKNQVATNDSIEVSLSNGVLMLIPSKRHTAKRDIMSFAGAGKGLWGNTHEDIETSIQQLRNSWTR